MIHFKTQEEYILHLLSGLRKKDEEIDHLQSRLAEFEDAQKQGRLHIAPCADGTEIWRVLDVDSEMMQLFEIEEPISRETYIHGYTEITIGEMNKDWFLTEEFAKSALKTKSTGGDN